MEDKLYSLDQLEALASGDSAFVNKMVDMFIQMAPESINTMITALAEDKLEDLGAAAQKVKPSFDMMGITTLKQPIRDLEQWGKNRTNVESIPGLLEEVTEVLNNVVQQLKAR